MNKPRFTPFRHNSCRYGAIMGRADTGGPFTLDMDLCVSRPQGEYDSGGAYWGTGSESVYAVWVRGKGHELGVMYVRAMSPAAAKQKAMEGE